jgi:hypothetical protein
MMNVHGKRVAIGPVLILAITKAEAQIFQGNTSAGGVYHLHLMMGNGFEFEFDWVRDIGRSCGSSTAHCQNPPRNLDKDTRSDRK